MEVIKFCHSAIVFFSFWFLFPATTFAYLGVNYGRVADNLPPSTTAVELVQSINATKVRIYDADRQVLGAFANTNVELIVAVGNEFLTEIASPEDALNWVKSNVQAYLPATKITGIAVGNEVLTLEDRSFSDNLVLAMQSVYNALVKLNLDKQVIVTTPHAVNVLQTSYPPSTGSFRQDLLGNIDKILKFHSKTGSPVFLNVYPFFAYKGNPKEIPLDYALLKPTVGIVDPNTNLHYENMLYAQIDAFHSAIASLGYKELAVHVSETGWPSKGDTDEAAATPENAKVYNQNVMKLITENKGTPMKPTMGLNAFIFALFNEDKKPGATSERNFGLFEPDGTPAYYAAPAGFGSGLYTSSSPFTIDGVKIALVAVLGWWLQQ